MERTEKDRGLPEAEGRRESAKRRLLGLTGSGGLKDAEALRIAEEAVSRARSEAAEREAELSAPPREEVRKRLGLRASGQTDSAQARRLDTGPLRAR